ELAGSFSRVGTVSNHPRSRGPIYQDLNVLGFMVRWENEQRTGASRGGAPEYYPLPEEDRDASRAAALKLLRACRKDYWEAEKTILAFVNAPPSVQAPILEAMQVILAAARRVAVRAVLFEGSPVTAESVLSPDMSQAAGGAEGVGADRNQA